MFVRSPAYASDMKKFLPSATILIVESAGTVQSLHLPHSLNNSFCPECSGLKSTAGSLVRLSADATFLCGLDDTPTEIEVESKEPVSNHGECSSFGEDLGVLPIVCSGAVAHCDYSNAAGAWLLYGFSYQNTPS